MRILGVLMFLSGFAGGCVAIARAFSAPRPRDLLYGVLAPVAALVAILGLILVFVPGFLD